MDLQDPCLVCQILKGYLGIDRRQVHQEVISYLSVVQGVNPLSSFQGAHLPVLICLVFKTWGVGEWHGGGSVRESVYVCVCDGIRCIIAQMTSLFVFFHTVTISTSITIVFSDVWETLPQICHMIFFFEMSSSRSLKETPFCHWNSRIWSLAFFSL